MPKYVVSVEIRSYVTKEVEARGSVDAWNKAMDQVTVEYGVDPYYEVESLKKIQPDGTFREYDVQNLLTRNSTESKGGDDESAEAYV